MSINKTEAAIRQALKQLSTTGFKSDSARAVARELEKITPFHFDTLRRSHLVKEFAAGIAEPTPPEPAAPAPEIEIETTAESFKATGKCFVSLDEFLSACNIDLTKWQIVKTKQGTWNMGYKDKNQAAQKLQLYTFSIECKPIAANGFDYQKARDFVIAEMKQHAPQYRKIVRTKPTGKHLLMFDAADVHFGKYAAYADTGDSYGLEIARTRVIEGVKGIIAKAAGYDIERVLLVFGNDVLHVDNATATTTGGTFQNTAGMWFEMFQAAKKTFVEVIEMLLSVADVDVVFNPSNHDYTAGYMLCDSLNSWFHTCPNVTFDGTPAHRKYYQYHKNLLGTTHGDGAKLADLPGLMAQESPQLWAATEHRYFYTHHVHHADRVKFRETKDFIGVTCEAVRSPSATDSWHAKKGYTGVPKAVAGFIHSRTEGQVARLTHVFNK